MLSKTQLFRWVLVLLLSFECSCYSMHYEEPQEESYIQPNVEWPYTDWRYYSFLKTSLETEERNDPPFYKLVTKEGRIIYILGSLHNRHPDLLLPSKVSNFLKDLSGKAVLFTEHERPYDFLLHKLAEISLQGPKIWKPTTEFALPQKEKKLWKDIKDRPIYDAGPKIKDIRKVEILFGAMFLYVLSGREGKEKGLEISFENCFLQLPWIGNIQHLESLEDCLSIIEETQEDLRKFFIQGLKRITMITQRVKALAHPDKAAKIESRIREGYMNDINSYDHDLISDDSLVKKSSVDRNSSWRNKIITYLEQTGDTESSSPILILCGMEHLKGEIKKDGRSFLAYLFNTGKFTRIYRMDKEGNWINFQE